MRTIEQVGAMQAWSREVRRRDGSFYVRDLGSLNGTYVNRERVDETELASGDELQIGKFKLVFFAGE